MLAAFCHLFDRCMVVLPGKLAVLAIGLLPERIDVLSDLLQLQWSGAAWSR
jgi:hypothetical protein